MMTDTIVACYYLESQCYLESKKLCPEAAIEKFLTKEGALQKLFYKVAILHLCSALLACFSRL